MCTDYESRWLGSKSVTTKSAVSRVCASKGVEDRQNSFKCRLGFRFSARDSTLFAEMAKQVSITQIDSNIGVLATTQQVVASTPISYTEDIHEALDGGGLRSMTDSEHDMVFLTFTNDSFTHWAVSCSLQYRSTESNMLNKHDSVFWFGDLEDGGELKRFNQTSFFHETQQKMEVLFCRGSLAHLSQCKLESYVSRWVSSRRSI